ncbi:hypothetical protein [Pseudoflavonifractor sp. 524-17]|uniref:hypothetical protein n=1 Tax=Pseudoflavonifractor sp. 524-17 TaxID=2304577 RepID=UPI00325BCD8F
MPASKAQQKAVNKYMAANYDRINVTMPKGKKDTIQAAAEAQGQSVNAFINAAINGHMAPGTGQEATGAPIEDRGISLSPSTLKAAQAAAQAAGEGVSEFIGRAVETQAQRDTIARKMKRRQS